MTECERMIAEKTLPVEFFQEEEICGFFVDKKRKKIWATALDLLLQFDKVCKEHNLKYVLIGGTLIGAVRHKGFIPWDDDVDVAMPRKDYELLCEKGQEWFDEPYFLQTPTNDEGYFFSFSKLRNSRATSIAYPYRYLNYNQGMAIDIFPLDKCILENSQENFNKIKELILENASYMRSSNPMPSKEDLQRIQEYNTDNPMKNCEEINRIASQYEDFETEYVGLSVCTIYNWERLTWYAEDFDEVIEGMFQGFSFPIPKGYDRVLKMGFGDYMKFPPVNLRGVWHNSTIMDPDVPYKEYKKNVLGIGEK